MTSSCFASKFFKWLNSERFFPSSFWSSRLFLFFTVSACLHSVVLKLPCPLCIHVASNLILHFSTVKADFILNLLLVFAVRFVFHLWSSRSHFCSPWSRPLSQLTLHLNYITLLYRTEQNVALMKQPHSF